MSKNHKFTQSLQVKKGYNELQGKKIKITPRRWSPFSFLWSITCSKVKTNYVWWEQPFYFFISKTAFNEINWKNLSISFDISSFTHQPYDARQMVVGSSKTCRLNFQKQKVICDPLGFTQVSPATRTTKKTNGTHERALSHFPSGTNPSPKHGT